MDTKLIIDKHFESNYDYYKRVCFKYCNGARCYEELLHNCYEEFLKVKQEVIIKFHELNRLYNIGLKIIRSLWQKRFKVKKYKRGETSELFDLSLSGLGTKIKDEPNQIENNCFSESDYLSLDKAVNDLLKDRRKNMAVTIFLQANELADKHEPNDLGISALARKSGISRFYITREYKKGKEYLKTHIKNERQTN